MEKGNTSGGKKAFCCGVSEKSYSYFAPCFTFPTTRVMTMGREDLRLRKGPSDIRPKEERRKKTLKQCCASKKKYRRLDLGFCLLEYSSKRPDEVGKKQKTKRREIGVGLKGLK